MADDFMQNLIRMSALQNAAMGGEGKPAYLFGWIPLKMECSAPFSLTSVSPLSKPIPAVMAGTGKAGCLGDKFLQACMAIPDELKKIAAEGKAIYDGPVIGAPSSGVPMNIAGLSSEYMLS